MEKEFIPYEQALALKELGFDETCLSSWTYKTKERIPTLYGCGALLFDTDGLITNQTEDIICSAPFYQQAFRWFRDTYNISGEIGINVMEDDEYCYEIGDVKTRMCIDEDSFSTHKQAELECLKKLIEIVKNK